MKNNIHILWEELELFLENDKDFQIIKIEDDCIEIKALHIRAFHINYIYGIILARIMPLNCILELESSYIQADDLKNDSFSFDLTINTKKNLFYKGLIKITKNDK